MQPEMAAESPSARLRLWWLPPATIVLAAASAAWTYRERVIDLNTLPPEVIRSSAALESTIGETPPRRVEYRAVVTIEFAGGRSESTIRHVAEHLGDGWIRRSDDWYDGGASSSTYQERQLLHRNLVQAYRKYRVMSPIVHDLLAEFGWLDDSVRSQTSVSSGAFPEQEASSLSVRQTRMSAADPQTGRVKDVRYDRTMTCRREGVIEGAQVGPALSGPYARVSCRLSRGQVSGEGVNIYVWHPQARLFLLIRGEQTTSIGTLETQTRRIDELSIRP